MKLRDAGFFLAGILLATGVMLYHRQITTDEIEDKAAALPGKIEIIIGHNAGIAGRWEASQSSFITPDALRAAMRKGYWAEKNIIVFKDPEDLMAYRERLWKFIQETEK